MKNVICKCGAIIPEDHISHSNGCNEEGEDYGVVSADCPACKREYETNQWGEFDDLEDAMELLSNYILEN